MSVWVKRERAARGPRKRPSCTLDITALQSTGQAWKLLIPYRAPRVSISPEILRIFERADPAPVVDMAPVPALLSHILKDMMHCDPSEHPVFITEPAWNDKANRERMAEILFEEFNVPAFYVANTSVLNA